MGSLKTEAKKRQKKKKRDRIWLQEVRKTRVYKEGLLADITPFWPGEIKRWQK